MNLGFLKKMCKKKDLNTTALISYFYFTTLDSKNILKLAVTS